jgi:hypothetical protein
MQFESTSSRARWSACAHPAQPAVRPRHDLQSRATSRGTDRCWVPHLDVHTYGTARGPPWVSSVRAAGQ